MLPVSSISAQKTYYEVLSVNEGATYDEIRAGYRFAILNVHPDKSQANPDSLVPSGKQGEFLSAQKAWEVLRDPNSRAVYDKQLQTSRCGDYFSISSCDLGEMGIVIGEDGKIDFQSLDCTSASVVLECASCSLKTRLVINKSS
ncbi:hypothetical protein BRADI_3g38110v3 [Brachypodium distachyon]|uniref:J domain-containing protein n=1 Tax=Brachypodium distachyon TaxID=15368 RepID=A0A2K2D1X8_BRADI|nr:hypothetical protein BRADI_3g38110v3 [Brachypodium distachyon]